MFAVIDVEANYLLHKAFQYTTFTSIQVNTHIFGANQQNNKPLENTSLDIKTDILGKGCKNYLIFAHFSYWIASRYQ